MCACVYRELEMLLIYIYITGDEDCENFINEDVNECNEQNDREINNEEIFN